MNIVHICSIDNDKANGISNVVPYHFIYQSKLANVAIINCNSIVIELLKNQKNYYSLDSLNNDIFNNPCFKYKIDIVVFHGIYFPKYIRISKQLKKYNIPYIIVPHGSLTVEAQKIKFLKKIIGNLFLFNKFIYGARAIQYLSNSEASRSLIKKDYFVSGNGMEKPKYKKNYFSDNGMKLIYVGRYDVHIKGLDLIIEACSLIKTFMENNNITIDLYGSCIEEKKKIIKLVSDNNLDKIISVNDSIFDKDKINKILEHDVFIQTSRSEGQPLGIMEAMFLGMPIIVSDGTTFGNVVKYNNCGYVCNSPKEISDKIIECFKNMNKLKLLSENSYLYALNNFSWTILAEQAVKEYKKRIKIGGKQCI